MTAPLITCGFTAYNAAAMIERAVHSALAQTWRPVEILVVDDVSTDGTVDILRRLQTSIPQLRLISHARNQGVAAARNTILNQAKGDFVAFFDDDDESHPERLWRQLQRILDFEKKYGGHGLVICHTARRQIYPDGRTEICPTMGQRVDLPVPFGHDVAERILRGTRLENGNGACATCSQMARLGVYRAVGGFDPSFRRSGDTELNVRLARAGCHFVGIADPLVTQTMTLSSEKRLTEECRFTLQLLDKHRDLLDAAGEYSFSRRWIQHKYAWLQGTHKMHTLAAFGALAFGHPVPAARRALAALQNVGYNRALRRFHRHATRPS